jgi:hypothetical protein
MLILAAIRDFEANTPATKRLLFGCPRRETNFRSKGRFDMSGFKTWLLCAALCIVASPAFAEDPAVCYAAFAACTDLAAGTTYDCIYYYADPNYISCYTDCLNAYPPYDPALDTCLRWCDFGYTLDVAECIGVGSAIEAGCYVALDQCLNS